MLFPFILKNHHFELTFVPHYGCHWTRLRIKSTADEWLDWLAPVEQIHMLHEQPNHLGAYLMAPWSNRIPAGMFTFEQKAYSLQMNFPDHTAIHGDVRRRPWKIKQQSAYRAEAILDSREFSDFNFPFALTFRHTLELNGLQLKAGLFMTNRDRRHAPAGFGFHPFFNRKLSLKDSDVMLIVPAGKVYPAADSIPTASPVPVHREMDLREQKYLGNPDIDDCYTALSCQTIQMIYTGTGIKTLMQCDPVLGHVVVYAKRFQDGTPRPYFAVEPVSHATNGFNLWDHGWPNTGVKVLEPGETWGGYITLSFESYEQH